MTVKSHTLLYHINNLNFQTPKRPISLQTKPKTIKQIRHWKTPSRSLISVRRWKIGGCFDCLFMLYVKPSGETFVISSSYVGGQMRWNRAITLYLSLPCRMDHIEILDVSCGSFVWIVYSIGGLGLMFLLLFGL